jgi:PAS domain S-box-containing protein
MLMVGAIILMYTFTLLLIVLPGVKKSTEYLEEKNGKEALNKVQLITKNMQANLENFQKMALHYNETELQDLTSVFWSLVQAKYEQSRQKNIGSILKARGDELFKDVTIFYEKNKKRMSTEELKQAIINYVNIFRYDQGSGYFFIHEKTTVVEHPLYPEFKGKDFAHIKDRNGVYFVQEFYNICKQKGSGILNYQWKHAKTKAIEDKVAYVFTFEPFDWIIGTSASINELQENLKNEVIYLANKMRYDQNNYFFINGYDYKVIAHPYIKQGTDFSEVRDSRGNLIVPPMIRVARAQGEGFTRYWWPKDPDQTKTFEKLTFSKNFPEWQMVISTGIYIDNIQNEINKRKSQLVTQLRNIVNKVTIGKNGYLYVIDNQGTIIIHPNKTLEGKNAKNFINPDTGENIFDELAHAGQTRQPMYYKWNKPADPNHYIYDKISWVEYIPKLQWYIVSSAYTDELQEISRQLKNKILFLGLSILLLSFLVSYIFFRKLLKPVTTLSSLASRVTRGDYSARSHLESNDEIGALAHEFNTMVDTIENNIHRLDQKTAEKTKEIEEQNLIFETLFYESSDGILLIQDGKFVDCNKSAYQMLNYRSKKELITLHPSEISPAMQPDGRNSQEKADEVMKTTLEKGTNRFEWVHLCKDGRKTFLEVVLTRVVIRDDLLIHVVWRDINDKKTAERHLQKTVNEFSAVMGAIDYGILFMDDQLQARIVNKACRDMWQLPDDFIARHPTMRELIELNRYNNLYPVSDDEFDQYMDQRVAEVRKGPIAPKAFKRKDGMILQYQCIVLPDDWRMLTYFDITQLKNTQDQLARAQKMETIGMMAGGVAHDLNNILSGIVSYPELLLLQLPKSSKLRKPLEAIQESGERAATVVADLLTVARGVASIREAHDINVLIQEYLHSPEYEKLISLHPDVHCMECLEATQAIISCSPVHIKKTIMNLVANAIEAIETTGEVKISTSNLIITSTENRKNTVPPGCYVVLTIQDNGPGISDNDVTHIFEPFYSKKEMGRSGTGLGLTVVWNTVEDHGGKIRVESSEKGTCFTLYLPRSTEDITHDEAQKETMDTSRGEHILVVDDEPLLRDIASHTLRNLGYKITAVSSGEEALEFIEKNPVDLLVLDMLMEPGINGRQTYEKILQLYPEQKAIIASGFSENDDVKATMKLGARGFIKKPYSIDQLGQVVREALQD